GSVPMAFLGSFLLREMDGSKAGQQHVEIALGAALLVGASAMVFRYVLDRRSGRARTGAIREVTLRPVPTVLIGSLLSSRAPDKYIRPAITFVIFASGLKYVGVPTYPLGFVMGGILVAGAGYWLAVRQLGQRRPGEPEPVPVLVDPVLADPAPVPAEPDPRNDVRVR